MEIELDRPLLSGRAKERTIEYLRTSQQQQGSGHL